MPIIPKQQHPLRRLRKVLNLQQKQLATLVGVSTRTIVAIENGQLRISRSLATKLYLETGAIPQSITAPIKGDKGYSRKKLNAMIPMGADGHPLTGMHKEVTRERTPPMQELAEIMDARMLLDVVLQAAADRSSFKPVLCSFFEWLDLTQKQFALEKTAARICETYQPPIPRGVALLPNTPARELQELLQHWETGEWQRETGWPKDMANRWLNQDISVRKIILDQSAAAAGTGTKAML